MDLAGSCIARRTIFLGIHGIFKHPDRILRSMMPHFLAICRIFMDV